VHPDVAELTDIIRSIVRLNTKSRAAIVFVLFALLSAVHTWPLASAPGRLSRNDQADTILNEWIVSWVAHQAPRDPAHLLDANIFYPERGTFAYSEYLLIPAAMGAPVLWLGGSPVLTYNLLILAGFTLTGWAGYLLISRWTGDAAAGLIGGVVLAFNAHTLTRLPQLQGLHVEFLPLALMAFDAMLMGDGSPALLALTVVLQALTSYYSLIFTLTALAAGWLARFEDWRLDRTRHVGRKVVTAAALALPVLVPALIPYARLGRVRPLDEVALYSAAARDYLSTPARIHYATWSGQFFGGTTALFPGVTSLALTAVAILTGIVWRDRRARMALAIGIAGVVLSFGPAVPGYALLYRLFPPLQGIRNAARFGYLAIVSAAILAGYGVAWLRVRWPRARWVPVAISVLFICANLDAFSAPIGYVDAEPISPLYTRLRHTDAIVAEFPFYPPDRAFHHASYMLHATAHWRPMLNGYSGIIPDSFVQHARDLANFPDGHAVETLHALGVTHVFVHDQALRAWTDNETADAVRTASGLVFVARDGDVSLYEVRAARNTP
jgi:hypothetical protein